MSLLERALRGARTLRPYAQRLIDIERESAEGGAVAVMPGEGQGTRFLSDLLGTSTDTGGHKDLVVWAPGPSVDIARGAEALAGRKREGVPVLALLVGNPAERRDLERRIGIGTNLELSDTAQVASLTGIGAQRAGAAVARALGDRRVAVARTRPTLRGAVGHEVVARSARRAAAVGVVGITGYAVISAIQVGMVANLAALHERELDAQAAAEAAGILGAGLGWRAIAKGGVGLVPLAGPLVRAGVAYTSTRALGELAFARFAAGKPLVGELPAPAKSAADQIIERLPGRDPGPSEGSGD